MATGYVTKAEMRRLVGSVMGAWDQATTSAAGNSAKTTAVAVSLSRKPAQYYRGWYAHLTSAAEYRRVESSQADGSLIFPAAYPWTAIVPITTVLDLYAYDPAIIDEAMLQALNDVWPTFFNDNDDESLWGRRSYGVTPDEYKNAIYDLPAAFLEVPTSIWLIDSYIGAHDGAESTTVLSDSTRGWTIDELVGQTPRNKTDGSVPATAASANTATTVTHGALAGGTLNKWSVGDEYIVQKKSAIPQLLEPGRFTIVNPTQKGAFRMYADIAEHYTIRLVGHKRLTAFTATETSETELTPGQARTVALMAAGLAFLNLAKKRPGNESLATDGQELMSRYYGLTGHGMPTVDRFGVNYAQFFRDHGAED